MYRIINLFLWPPTFQRTASCMGITFSEMTRAGVGNSQEGIRGWWPWASTWTPARPALIVLMFVLVSSLCEEKVGGRNTCRMAWVLGAHCLKNSGLPVYVSIFHTVKECFKDQGWDLLGVLSAGIAIPICRKLCRLFWNIYICDWWLPTVGCVRKEWNHEASVDVGKWFSWGFCSPSSLHTPFSWDGGQIVCSTWESAFTSTLWAG